MKYYGIQNEVKAYVNRLQSEQGITVSSSVLKAINDRVEALKKTTTKLISYNDINTIYLSL
jgi:L-lysine 2,3-aminomutase